MAIYSLTEELVFPGAMLADTDGLLAFGGDLSPERLLLAYSNGIFPWYSDGQPILWWSPDPRMVLYPANFKRHKNLRRTVESKKFEVRFDTNFRQVIEQCGKVPRKDQLDTWITSEMIEAYILLQDLGFCHSVETYLNGELVGGLYGISLGGVFFGESMFQVETDASKVALWHLVEHMTNLNFDFIDVQQETSHLRSLGAEPIPRRKFITLLSQSLKKDTLIGKWETNQ